MLGSLPIGQPFTSPKHFRPRPSATAPVPYNAAASSGSIAGPLNPALADAVKARIEGLRALLGLLGEARVNVLTLNLALDALHCR